MDTDMEAAALELKNLVRDYHESTALQKKIFQRARDNHRQIFDQLRVRALKNLINEDDMDYLAYLDYLDMRALEIKIARKGGDKRRERCEQERLKLKKKSMKNRYRIWERNTQKRLKELANSLSQYGQNTSKGAENDTVKGPNVGTGDKD